MKIPLGDVAFARSGDKGDTANIGVIAIAESAYPMSPWAVAVLSR